MQHLRGQLEQKPLTFSVRPSLCVLPFLSVPVGPWTTVSSAVKLASDLPPVQAAWGGGCPQVCLWDGPVRPCPALLGWVLVRQPDTAEEQLSAGLAGIRVIVRTALQRGLRRARGAQRCLGCLAASDLCCWGIYRQDATPAWGHLPAGKIGYFQVSCDLELPIL